MKKEFQMIGLWLGIIIYVFAYVGVVSLEILLLKSSDGKTFTEIISSSLIINWIAFWVLWSFTTYIFLLEEC